MASRSRAQPWRPDLATHRGPVYQAIVDAIDADIAAGRLAPGARLPSQRALAGALGVNLTTVTRAMREAERRGLVTGLAGSGTYVAPRVDRVRDWASPEPRAAQRPFVDLSLNLPPDVADAELAHALGEWARALARRPQEARTLLPYRALHGAASDRAAAAAWLADRGIDAPADRIVITSGAQHGLALALGAITRPGDAVLCEALTYPGLKAAATVAGVRLIPIPLDEHGLVPAAARAAIRRHSPRVLVCCATLHNPTGVVWPVERRRELAKLAQRSGLWVIEDDVYGALIDGGPAPLAALAPERTVYVTSLSKTVAPGLRVGYLVAPEMGVRNAVIAALRASTWMTAPMLASIASAWIGDGTARKAARQIRSELLRRNRTLRRILPPVLTGPATASASTPHLWIPLRSREQETRTVSLLDRAGIGVTAGDAFRTADDAGFGFRVCLGAAASAAALERALTDIRRVLEQADDVGDRMVL